MESRTPPTPGARPRSSDHRIRNLAIVLGLIVLAFGIGFGWQFLEARSLEGELTTARRELALSRLEATVAAAAVQAERGDYEAARRLTSDFFTGLQEEVDRGTVGAQEVGDLLTRRDALITSLSRAEPDSRDVLHAVFARFRVTAGGPERALPSTDRSRPAPGEAEPSEPAGVGEPPTAADTAG